VCDGEIAIPVEPGHDKMWGVSPATVRGLGEELAGYDQAAFEAQVGAGMDKSDLSELLFYTRKLVRLVCTAAARGDGLVGVTFED
jgi:hypothetical protein